MGFPVFLFKKIMKIYPAPISLFAIFIALISCTSCSENQTNSIPDYRLSENWVLLPGSDIFDVDVFYVYPTVYNNSDTLNMDIRLAANRKAAQDMTIRQSRVYSDDANVYAPYYQQMALEALSLPKEQYEQYYSIAYADVVAAFNYYLEHFNNGRPFILAGHSQGSLMILDLMKEKFNEEQMSNQLIAAYTIGYSFTNEDAAKYPWMKLAQKEDDFGVIITYNTQSPEATGSPVLLPGALCVNPLNWKTDTTYAPDSMHLGAVKQNTETGEIIEILPEYTDAQIGINGALIVNGPNPDDFYTAENKFPKGVFHAYDYPFFFLNLKQNVKKRIDAFHKASL